MLIIVPAFIPLIALAAGLEYLRRNLLPSAPPTSSVTVPYTPPFNGGQCLGAYIVRVSLELSNDGGSTWVNFNDNTNYRMQGRIRGIRPWNRPDGRVGWQVFRAGADGAEVVGAESFPTFTQLWRNFRIREVIGESGNLDNCGNLPNPSPAPPIASDGVADSPAPSVSGDNLVVSGSPIVPYNPLSAAIAALLAALKAASDLKDAIDFIGDMLDKIGRGIDDVKDWLDDKNKNPDSGKDVKRHDFGSIGKDGFLRLYPNGENNGYKPLYVDLQLLSIPVGYGKYFGDKSPHFYRFKSLGYISFVSSTFGVLETHEVEFSRASLQVPELAYGFFYHLGLEDMIRANVSLFYLVDKPIE